MFGSSQAARTASVLFGIDSQRKSTGGMNTSFTKDIPLFGVLKMVESAGDCEGHSV